VRETISLGGIYRLESSREDKFCHSALALGGVAADKWGDPELQYSASKERRSLEKGGGRGKVSSMVTKSALLFFLERRTRHSPEFRGEREG